MSALKRRDDHLSDLAFDEWFGDALAPDARREFEVHIEHCGRCRSRREALAAQHAVFLERVPSWQALAAKVGAAPSRPSARRRLARFGWAAGAVSAALVIALALLPARAPNSAARSKGRPHIGAFIKRGERVERVESGARVQPGDFVRFTYSSQQPMYFALLNRDARHAATYYPLDALTVRVAAGSDVALDFSIKLDDQPGDERVHGVFCDRPEPLEPLRAQLETTGRLPALPHCQVDVLTLTRGPAGE